MMCYKVKTKYMYIIFHFRCSPYDLWQLSFHPEKIKIILLSTWTYIFHSSASSPESCCRSNINADDLIWKQQKLRIFFVSSLSELRWSENPNQSNLDKKCRLKNVLNGWTFWLNKSVTEDFGPHHIGKMFYVSVLCLQIIASILTEQRMVFFSSDWAKLTLIIECFMLYIWPLHWQHPLVPILSQHMLDFVMAPTAFLMGCHISHYEDVAKVKPK